MKTIALASLGGALLLTVAACGGDSNTTAATTAAQSVTTPTSASAPSSSSTSMPSSTSASSSNGSTSAQATSRTSSAPSSAAGTCGTLTEQQAVSANLVKVPLPQNSSPSWIADTGMGTYDPCAELSYELLHPSTGTGRFVERQVMLFNKGRYLGTATAKGYPVFSARKLGTNALQLDYVDTQIAWDPFPSTSPNLTTFTYTNGKVTMTGADPSKLGH